MSQSATSLPAFERLNQVHLYWLSTLAKILVADLDPRMPSAEVATAREIQACQGRGDPQAAAALLSAAVKRTDKSGDFRANEVFCCWLASLLLTSGQLASAADFLQKVLARRPTSSVLSRAQGVVDLLAGRHREGVDHLQAAVDMDSQDGPAWACLAIVYGLTRDHLQAEVAARHALRLGIGGPINLVGLVLLQSTIFQEKTPEGAFDFSSLGESSPAEIDEFLRRLPPVDQTALTHPVDSARIVFLCCEHRYCLDFGIPLILSIADSGTDCSIHLHVINPGRNLLLLLQIVRERIAPLRLVISTESAHVEQFGTSSVYYSSVRYLRLVQLLRANQKPVVMLDADALVRGDLAKLPGLSDPNSNVGLCRQPSEPIWQEMTAAAGFFKPAPQTIDFLADVGRFIAANLLRRTGQWFLDQVALYLAWRKHRHTVSFHFLAAGDVCDLQQGNESLIWGLDADKRSKPRFTDSQKKLAAKYQLPTIVEPVSHPTEIVETKFGRMLIWSDDRYIGLSLKSIGTWCEHEIELLKLFIRPGYTVIDAGANVGSHTLAFSCLVGPTGRVVAFEPQRAIHQLLMASLALNGISNVQCRQQGLGDRRHIMQIAPPHERNNFGAVALVETLSQSAFELVEVIALDTLELDACHLIKMDIEGMEYAAILGATRTIERHRPVLYVENLPSSPRHQELIDLIHSLKYRVFDHGLKTVHANMLCVPEEFLGVLRGLTEILPHPPGHLEAGLPGSES